MYARLLPVLVCGTAAALPAQSLLSEASGTQKDARFGYSLAGGADFDLDGHADLVVGAPYADAGGQTDCGVMLVISGRDGSTLHQESGDAYDDHYGWSVAIAGDVDADGWPDLVVGAPNALDPSIEPGRPGLVRVVSGRTWSALYTVYGSQDLDELGYSVAGGLDVSGTGTPDILVGSPGDGGTGAYWVLCGANGLGWLHVTGNQPGERVGAAVAAIGDLDQDGSPDMLIGSPGFQTLSGAAVGRIRVTSGAWPYPTLFARTGSAGSLFGSVLSGGLDLDLDGRAESFLVGAPEDPTGGPEAGSVTRFSGFAPSVHTWYGAAPFDRLGSSLAVLPDVDGDGRQDFVAGALEQFAGGLGSGRVFSAQTFQELYRVHGESGTRFGFAVAAAGDTNADGFGDFAVGAPHATNPGGKTKAGQVRFFSGSGPGIVPYCTAGTSGSGCRAVLTAFGTPSATSDEGFFVDAQQVESEKTGLFFHGSSGRQANPWGNGTSFQCVVPPVKRSGLLAQLGTSGLCKGRYQLDMNARWCPTCPKPNHNPGLGAVAQIQLWYRDPTSTSNQTTSLSNAVEFVVGP